MYAKNTKLTESQLLNANNKTSFTGKADVVVCGGSITGLIYAIRLKTVAPDLDIMVAEKSRSPVQKIGESTLPPFSKFCDLHGIESGYLLRLFGVKDGLDFFCFNESGSELVGQDVGGFDVSYQLDRRVS